MEGRNLVSLARLERQLESHPFGTLTPKKAAQNFHSLGKDFLLELLVEVGFFQFAPFRSWLHADSTIQLDSRRSLFPVFAGQADLQHGMSCSLLLRAFSGLQLRALQEVTQTGFLPLVVDFTPVFVPLF